MRTFKFRGKGIKSGQWFYGSAVSFGNKAYIFKMFRLLRMEHAEVDPETVGQFTGLTDKNGKEIYEGDVIRFVKGQKRDSAQSEWNDNDVIIKVGWVGAGFNIAELSSVTNAIETLGNIYDNPKLIEKGGER